MKTCTVEGCERTVKGKGYCKKHYTRWLRHGSPTTLLKAPPGSHLAFVEAVVAGEAPTTERGCVLWPFSLDPDGYPKMTPPGTGRKVSVGTVVLERTVGPRPSSGHTVGHAPHSVCGHRSCVSPAHLSWQTRAEQSAQQSQADRTAVGPKRMGLANPSATVPDAHVVEAVARHGAGETLAAIAADYGVYPQTIWTWVRGQYRASAFTKETS